MAQSRFLFKVDIDASIIIDGIAIGTIIKDQYLSVDVFPGEHHIVIRSTDNKYEWSKDVSVEPDKQEIINVTLTSTNPDIGVVGEFIDPRDNNVYKTVTINGFTWLGENLKFNSHNSFNYDGVESNKLAFGKLYTYSSARQFVPQGWHLPKINEWQSLINTYGANNIVDFLSGGISNFNLMYGGAAFKNQAGKIIDSVGANIFTLFWVDDPANTSNNLRKGISFQCHSEREGYEGGKVVKRNHLQVRKGLIIDYNNLDSLCYVRAVKNRV